MKKPVIASNLPPLDELVIDGETGFLLDHRKPGQWAQKLCFLLEDAQLQQEMGEKAYQHCLANFNLTTQAKKVQTVYTQLLDNPIG